MFTKHRINNSPFFYVNRYVYYLSNQKLFYHNKKTNLKHLGWSVVVLNEKITKNVFLLFINGDMKYKKGINKNRNSSLKK